MANPAFIQEAITAAPGAASAATITQAYTTANLTAGSILACAATWDTDDETPTCADGINGAWTAGPKLFDGVNGQGMACFFFKNTAGGGKPTVTVTFSVARDFRGLHICEIGPADTTTQPDVAAPAVRLQSNPGTGADAVASNAIVPVTDQAYIYGVTFDIAGVVQASAGTGFNSNTGWSSSVPSRAENKLKTPAGSTTATFTLGAGTTRMLTAVMAFRPVAAGGVAPAWNPPSLFPNMIRRRGGLR